MCYLKITFSWLSNFLTLPYIFFTLSSCLLYTLLLFLLHIPPHFLIHTVCFIPYNLMIFTFIWYKSNGCMVRKQRINETKARLKSGKTHLKVMPHRPLWTWRTVDARVYNDRYEHGERSVWDDFLNAFARLSQGFRSMVCFVLCCSFILYGFLYQWLNIVVVKWFLYFVRSFNLRFLNKRYFAAKLLGDGGKTKNIKGNNIINNDRTTSTTLYYSILSL